MSSMFTTASYNRGVPVTATPTWYPNLAPDPGAEDGTYTPSIVGNAYGTNYDQYRQVESTLGAGGSVSTFFSTSTIRRSGARSLSLSVGTTSATTTWVSAFTPNFDVEPGATYLGSVWAAKNTTGAVRVYLRPVGGSTDALSEYGGLSGPAAALPMTISAESVNVGGALASTFQELVVMFTVPANITRAAFRVYNYLPAVGCGIYFDEFRAIKVDNTPFCDTGWISLPLANGWVDYGSPYPPAAFRKIGGIVYVRGLLKNGTVTNNTVMANLPAGFRPAFDQFNPAQVATPGSTFARIDTTALGEIMGRIGLVAGWTAIALAPFPAEL